MSGSGRNDLDRRHLLRAGAIAGIAAVSTVAQTTRSSAVIWEEGELQCRAWPVETTGPEITDALLADFMDVSRVLTGVPLSSVADLRLGREYLERYARVATLGEALPKLVAAYRDVTGGAKPADPDAVAAALMNNDAVRPAAQQLIYLWYLSAFFLPPKPDPAKPGDVPKPAWIYGTTDQYERALLWSAIGAHAPMMPMRGAGENYWAQRPHLSNT
jgi:D-sorbitol dehydrogenase-like protein